MSGGIHHKFYRVLPHHWSRGFYYAICRVCPSDIAYISARHTNQLECEKAVIAHLKDKHGIEDTKESA